MPSSSSSSNTNTSTASPTATKSHSLRPKGPLQPPEKITPTTTTTSTSTSTSTSTGTSPSTAIRQTTTRGDLVLAVPDPKAGKGKKGKVKEFNSRYVPSPVLHPEIAERAMRAFHPERLLLERTEESKRRRLY